MRNVCNVHMPHAMGNIISSISIDIGIAAADSIGYWVPARYRSNPRKHSPDGAIKASVSKSNLYL